MKPVFGHVPVRRSPTEPGVMSECCGALVKEFRMGNVRWWECLSCGAVIQP